MFVNSKYALASDFAKINVITFGFSANEYLPARL